MTKRNQRKIDVVQRGEDSYRKIKDKFVDERETEIQTKRLIAKTDKQQEYLNMLNDPKVQIIVCLGLHGSGKSFLAASVAADKYRTGAIKKIIVARPYVQTGKSSGSKPGTALEKLYPYVRNILDTIKQRIGSGAYDVALADGQKGSIEVQEVESIRGRSFDLPSFLLIDEAQQSTEDEMLAIVTRISDNCKLVLCGDENQRDIKTSSGLAWFLDFAKRHKLANVGIINFNSPDDIVRGGIVKDIAIGLIKDGRIKGEL